MSERWTFDRVWVKHHELIPDRWEWVIEDDHGVVAWVPEDEHDEAARHARLIAEAPAIQAERDALRGISNDVLWLTRLAVSSSWPGEMAEQVERAAARVRALLDPEVGGGSPLFTSAQPMSPTMRQAVEEAKQRPPARHFEPSTLLEDGGVDE